MLKHSFFAIALLFVSLLALIACSSSEPQPQEIYPEDMCACCRMAISQKEFASQIISKKGESWKYDDICCFIGAMKNRSDEIAASFVADYSSKKWIYAKNATFLHAPRLNTPMGSGFVAFEKRQDAEKMQEKFPGAIMTLSEVLSQEK